MDKLEKIKNEYARSYGHFDWDDYMDTVSVGDRELAINDIVKKYAEECIKASLEKAADSAEIQESPDDDYCDYIDRLSITKTENIVLL